MKSATPFLTFLEMRIARQLDLCDVASQLGVTEDVLKLYEANSGLIPSSKAASLCRIYKVPSIEYIFIGEQNKIDHKMLTD